MCFYFYVTRSFIVKTNIVLFSHSQIYFLSQRFDYTVCFIYTILQVLHSISTAAGSMRIFYLQTISRKKLFLQKNWVSEWTMITLVSHLSIYRTIFFHQEGKCLFAGSQDILKVYGWEPTRCYDSLAIGWARVSDTAVAQNQLVIHNFSISFTIHDVWCGKGFR